MNNTKSELAVRDAGDLASGAKVLTLIGRAAIDPTVSALSAALSDCENEASSSDDLAVIVGKMSLRHVVQLARRAHDQQKSK